jgi:hypothetical protein
MEGIFLVILRWGDLGRMPLPVPPETSAHPEMVKSQVGRASGPAAILG